MSQTNSGYFFLPMFQKKKKIIVPPLPPPPVHTPLEDYPYISASPETLIGRSPTCHILVYNWTKPTGYFVIHRAREYFILVSSKTLYIPCVCDIWANPKVSVQRVVHFKCTNEQQNTNHVPLLKVKWMVLVRLFCIFSNILVILTCLIGQGSIPGRVKPKLPC